MCPQICAHTHVFTENRAGLGGLLCDPGHSLHNNRAKGKAKTAHRQGGGKKGDVVLLHTSVNARTHAGVSTRLEHVPAACMLVCMCNHACCYLCGGEGPWCSEVQGLQGLMGGGRVVRGGLPGSVLGVSLEQGME